MKTAKSRNTRYFDISNTDGAWGIVVIIVGHQPIPPHNSYPRSQHLRFHIFEPQRERALKKYQLVYIPEGKGWFELESCRRQEVKAGAMLLLFPNEWCTYGPDQGTGWFECWMGFRGEHIDKWVSGGFFTSQHPVFHIGSSFSIIGPYEDITNYTLQGRSTCQ